MLAEGRDTELVLSRMLAEYRWLVDVRGRGRLVLINLQKRLLSSVAAFARTLTVHATSLGLAELGRAPADDDADELVDDDDTEATGETDAVVDEKEAEQVRDASRTIVVHRLNVMDRFVVSSKVMIFHAEHHEHPTLPYRQLEQLAVPSDDVNRYATSRLALLARLYRELPA